MSTSPRLRRYDLIAFDWDGTLFDSTGLIVRCIQDAVRDVGGTVATREAASYVIGLGLMQALAHAAPDVPKDKYPALGEANKRHNSARQNDVSLFEGTLPVLHSLRARTPAGCRHGQVAPGAGRGAAARNRRRGAQPAV